MRQSGFTLIEAMVAGALSVMIAGVVLALIRTNNLHLAEGMERARLAMLHDALTAEIGRLCRQAWIVKVDGDPSGAAPFDTAAPVAPNQKSVVFCNRAGDSLGGVRILENGGLEELAIDPENPSSLIWRPLAFGPVAARLNTGVSEFEVLPHRQGITFRLAMQMMGGEVSLEPVRETVLTRNGWAYR